MYTHLTAHSSYSLQEGLLSPSDLVEAAQARGMQALGLTDHYLLTGAVEFVNACKNVDIQPVIGLEIDLKDGPLHLFAMSVEGWSNLCRLSSAIALRDEPDLICTLQMLAAYSADLLALGSHSLEELKPIFQDRLYVSLQDITSAFELSKLATMLTFNLLSD